MARGEHGLSVGVNINVGAKDIAIAADDLFSLRIPHDELLVAVWHGVELIDIHTLAGAAASLSEGYLTKTADFLHHVGRFMSRYDIYFVVALVCHSQLALWSELLLEQFLIYWLDNLLFHFLMILL